MPDQLSRTILNILQELDHTDMVYLLGDLCAIRGWDPQVTIGDTSTPGDLIARSYIPAPESVALVVADEADVTSTRVQQFAKQSDEDRLSIVTGGPVDRLKSAEEVHGTIGFLSHEDLVREILITSTADILETYLPGDSPYRNELAQLTAATQETPSQESILSDEPVPATETEGPESGSKSANNGESDSETTTDQRNYQTAETISERATDSIGAECEFFRIEYIGHDYAPAEDESGMFVAFDVFAKEYDIEIRPNHFFLYSSEGLSYEGARPWKTDWVTSVLKKLPPSWGGRIDTVPAGGRIKYLVFVPTSEPVEPEKIRYTSNYAGLFTLSDEQIENQLGNGTRTEVSTEMTLDMADGKSSLPDEVQQSILQLVSVNEL